MLTVLSLTLWRAGAQGGDNRPGRFDLFALWGGLVISVLMSAAVLQMMLQRAKVQQQTQRHLEAIESLNAISTAINARIGSGTAFDELAKAAGRLLGMSRSGVCVLDDSGRTLEVIAAAGDMPAQFPKVFNLDRLPVCSHCLESKTVYFSGDIRRTPQPYSFEVAATFGVVSLILIPLVIQDRPIGLLTFSSSEPREFNDLDRRVAELLGSQASVILSNARLLEQTRTDAQAKSVLLRELNHRVKNNLAGIVALLGMDRPDMPDDVRLWLDRATDRIRALAGAHQLFTGGVEGVALDSLVAQTLSALSVVKPRQVTIRTDLDGVQVRLGAEQTIGLAMVLHELCYNALVHGLRGGGTLTVRARNAEKVESDQTAQRIVLEVADDGPGWCTLREEADSICTPVGEGQPSVSSGHGLLLVEGLVRRELRGKFLLRTQSGGGTVATVEFPSPRGGA
jgi:two-component sensor histidine kinase